MAGKAAVDGTPSGGVTGMSFIANAETMRAAIARDGGLCVTCGRPCKAGEARQRIVADKAPDDPINWVAMCRACQEALAGRLPPPASFVYHVHDASRFRTRLRQVVHWTLATFTFTVLAVLGAALGWFLYVGVHGVEEVLFSLLASALLLGAAYGIFLRVIGEHGPPVQRVHHTHEPQTVTVKEHR